MGAWIIFYFLSFLFGWKWKSKMMEKMSLNKVTYILLLKNDTQLKKKVTNNHKKEQLPKFIKKNKNQVFKKKTITLRP